ncbi:hypothetical protein EVAR_18218_1 [Eumeta japonica]|uniref:Uncharacterized protein n=1 Tax=Eumeta variegata TaxID=151549 RepID=A0A4C1UJC6_EUMVA|nr:hypothetical protein EVAR_18218_1 [Eumeta japonica]
MASCFGDKLRMFTKFSFCKSGPFAQFTGWDPVFLLEEFFNLFCIQRTRNSSSTIEIFYRDHLFTIPEKRMHECNPAEGLALNFLGVGDDDLF